MIVSEYVPPNQNIFYIGAKLIEIIKRKRNKNIDIIELYSSYISKHGEVSFESYVLSIIWLYILNIVDESNDEKGSIYYVYKKI